MATLDTEDKNFYLQAGWAKDKSIRDLEAKAAVSNNLLALIAKNTGKDSRKTEEDVEKALQGNTVAIQQQTNATVDLGKVQRDIQKSTRDLQKSLYKNVSSLERLGSTDAKGMFGGVSNTLNSMVYELGEVNPALAELAGGAAIVAEVFSTIWKRGTELAQATFDMYDSGIAVTNGMDQLVDASNATGLNLQQLGKAFTKNGQVVAAIGIDRTIKLGKAFNELTHGGTDLGMNFEQAQETLLSYSEIMRSTGEIGKRSNSELVAGAVEYGHTLNMLSQATGKRREQIDQEIKQQLKRPDMQILINSLAPSVRAAAQKGLEGLNAFGDEAPDLQKMMAGMVTRGESGMREANQPFYDALSQTGAGLSEFKAMTQATMKGDLVAQQQHAVALKKVMQDYAVRMRGYVNDASPMGEAARAAQKFATSAETVEELARRTPDQLAKAAEADKAAAEIIQANQDVTKTMLRLNNSLTLFAAKALVPMANAIDYVVTAFNKLLDNLGILVQRFQDSDVYKFISSGFSNLFETLGTMIKNSWFGHFLGGSMGGATGTDANGKPVTGPSMTGGEMLAGGALATISTVIIAKLIGRVFKTMMSMGGAVKSLLGMGKTPAMDAMKTASPMERMRDARGRFTKDASGGGMLTSVESLGEKLGNALRGIGSMIKDTISGIATTLKTVLTEVSQGLGSALTNISKGLGDSFSSISQGLGSALTNISKGLGDAFSNISRGLGESFTNLSKGIGDAIGNLSKGLSTALESFSAAIGKSIGSISKGLGEMLANLGTGVGKGLGGLIQGLGMGIAALGPEAPMILLGSAAIAGAILMIGGAVAGATWIMGAALPKFAEGMKSFEDLDGDKLGKTGTGMIKIGGGLIAMGAGDVASAVGGFIGWVGKLFSEDPIEKLKKFSELGEPLGRAGDSMDKFATAFSKSMAAINSAKLDPSILESLSKLGQFFQGDGFFASIGKSLEKLVGIGDPIDKLKTIGDISEPLTKAGAAISNFSDVYPKSMAAINSAILNPAAIASLDKLKTIFEGDGFFASVGKWLTGNDDFVTKLVKLGESTANVPTFSSRLTGFADAYLYLVEAFNQPISTEALANLTGLTDLIHKEVERSSPGLIGSLFGSSTAAAPATGSSTTAVQAAGAKVAITTPDQKHKELMEIMTKINLTLQGMSTIEDSQLRVMRTGFNQVSGTVY
jgi:hypothetical protein